MQRYQIKVEYDGTNFVGWQYQKNGLSIQEILQNAIFQFSKEKVTVTGAGRTDAGVHAYCQTIHFDTSSVREIKSWIEGGNALLPKDIRIIWAKGVTNDFHSRFSAISRTYRYIISCFINIAIYFPTFFKDINSPC